MTSERKRVRHGAEDEATAYRLQLLGAREGAIKVRSHPARVPSEH
jgi:hypothetical protein